MSDVNGSQVHDEAPVIKARTAFLVYLDEETAQWRVAPELTVGIRVARPPIPDDFVAAGAVIHKDVIVTHTVELMMDQQERRARRMAEEMARQQALQKLQPQEKAAVQNLLRNPRG